jgi:hypothetical protein
MTALQITLSVTYLTGAILTGVLAWRYLVDEHHRLDGVGLTATIAILWPAFAGVATLSILFYGIGTAVARVGER